MVSIISIVIVAAVVFALIVGKRKYAVVRRFENKDGIVEKKVVAKFWRIEDALEYIKSYDWFNSDVALNLLNTSRKDGMVKTAKGEVFNSQLVYFVTADGSVEGTSFASEQELDALESALDFKLSEA